MSKATHFYEEFKELKHSFKVFCLKKKMSLHEGLIRAMKEYMKQK